jgi:ASPIC/UnbV protein
MAVGGTETHRRSLESARRRWRHRRPDRRRHTPARRRVSGSSYLSSDDFRVHFGLGDVATVDHVEIHWPSGAVEQLKLSAVDRIVTMEEGKGMSTDLCRDCGAGKSR